MPSSGSTPDGVTVPMRFGVVDVETSGLTLGRHRVLQIGLVIVEIAPPALRAVEVDRWSTMVRLPRPWSRVGPRQIHGIRRRDLWRAPRPDEALSEFRDRLGSAIFTAHNAEFDAGFIQDAAQAAGVTLDLGHPLCTLRLSRRLDPDRLQSHRLGDLCTRYGVSLDRPHDALEDALATASVLPHLLAAHGIVGPHQLAPFCVRTDRPTAPRHPGPSSDGRPQLTS